MAAISCVAGSAFSMLPELYISLLSCSEFYEGCVPARSPTATAAPTGGQRDPGPRSIQILPCKGRVAAQLRRGHPPACRKSGIAVWLVSLIALLVDQVCLAAYQGRIPQGSVDDVGDRDIGVCGDGQVGPLVRNNCCVVCALDIYVAVIHPSNHQG